MSVEVPKEIFLRHSARREIIFLRADFAGNLSWAVHLFYVELHERGFRLGANFYRNVRGLAIKFEDGGRGNFIIVRLRDNRRLAFTTETVDWNFGVVHFLATFHAEIPLLSSVSIDVRI